MASREVFHFDEFTLEPRDIHGYAVCNPNHVTKAARGNDARPRGTVAAKSFAANFESIP